MRIGILGVGNTGATLTRRLSATGHQVTVANSRGPETIPTDVLADGARAVRADEAATDVDALILSVPLARIPELHDIVAGLPDGAVLLDSSNYYPLRDGAIAALDQGQVESEWVSEQLGGRPVVKAWNAILAGSFRTKATTAGDPDRIALPVAADSPADRELGMSLVEDTGFDGYDAGTLAESWRQQPGTPSCATDLTRAELPAALAAADATRSPRRRDLAWSVIAELVQDPGTDRGNDLILRINRLLYS